MPPRPPPPAPPGPPPGPIQGLNPADMDLCIEIFADGLEATSTSKDGMGYMFGGVRGSSGVMSGRWFFAVQLVSSRPVNVREVGHLRTSLIARVGVSQLPTPLSRLGEVSMDRSNANVCSIGYNSTGSIVHGNTWTPYGERYGQQETVIVFLDLAGSGPGRIGFAKGGTFLGFCTQTIPRPTKQSEALFPHLLLRNCRLRLDLTSPLPPSLAMMGLEGGDRGGPYQPWAESLKLSSCSVRAPAIPRGPSIPPDMIMMVGLPGSGKTTWAFNHASANPDRRYLVLSPEAVLDAMRVLTLRMPAVQKALASQRESAGEALPAEARADDGNMDQIEMYYNLAYETYQLLRQRAIIRQCNLILDQTHLSEATRMDCLKGFKGTQYVRRAALAAPLPAYLDMMQENSQPDGAPPVPDQVVANLMAQFVAPRVGGPERFTEVLLVHTPPVAPEQLKAPAAGIKLPPETDQEKLARVSQKVVARQRAMAQKWLLPPTEANEAAAPKANPV